MGISKHNTESTHHSDVILEHDGVSNHKRLDCLLNRLFRCRSKKTSKLRVTGICEGNSPVTGEFPARRASNAEIFPFDDVIIEWQRCQTYLTLHNSVVVRFFNHQGSEQEQNHTLTTTIVNIKNRVTDNKQRSEWSAIRYFLVIIRVSFLTAITIYIRLYTL